MRSEDDDFKLMMAAEVGLGTWGRTRVNIWTTNLDAKASIHHLHMILKGCNHKQKKSTRPLLPKTFSLWLTCYH